jgi:hypothetical protein
VLRVACISASQAFWDVALRLPHIRLARLNPAGGKLDQRCFCAVSVQANCAVAFSASLSVARKAFAAATILGVASPAAVAGVALAARLAVATAAVVEVVVAAVLAAVPVVAVVALVAAPVGGAVVAAVVADEATLGADATVVGGLVVPPHAARSTAPPDRTPRLSRKERRLSVRGRVIRSAIGDCGSGRFIIG